MRWKPCTAPWSTAVRPWAWDRRWWQRRGSGLEGTSQARIVSSLDRDRLYDAIPFTIPLPVHARELFSLLSTATPLPPTSIPADLVTMNSVVCIRDADTGEVENFDLVYPFEADQRPLGRSITAPLGAAVFGRHVGERATWHAPRGERGVVIDAILYQPEREGHYHR